MAAPKKMGLDYYPRDVNVSKDVKFVKAKIKYGYLALVVYDVLLEIVYSDKGYYIDYSENEKEAVVWNILESLRGKYHVEADTVYSVIEMLVECRLFSHDHFKQGIITSKRIQETYYKATVERKNVKVDKKIWMLSIDRMRALSERSDILSFFDNQPNNEDNQPSNEDNQPNNKQSKVKESKVKESNNTFCSEVADAASEPQDFEEPPIISLTLNTGYEYPIFNADVIGWCELYPAVDVMQELRKMKGWLNDNPKKRKTKQGIKRFIGGWLRNEQDRGRSAGSGTRSNANKANNFKNFEERDYADNFSKAELTKLILSNVGIAKE